MFWDIVYPVSRKDSILQKGEEELIIEKFAVQAIVAVSDKQQIEKIKKEVKGVHSIETKLKTWDYYSYNV